MKEVYINMDLENPFQGTALFSFPKSLLCCILLLLSLCTWNKKSVKAREKEGARCEGHTAQ
jgi:hypothetical protein